MKSKILLSLSALLCLLFVSCAAGPNTQRGALTGGAIGAAAGAVLGNNLGDGNAGRGALIGAGLGAAAGGAMGHQKDQQQGYAPPRRHY